MSTIATYSESALCGRCGHDTVTLGEGDNGTYTECQGCGIRRHKHVGAVMPVYVAPGFYETFAKYRNRKERDDA